MQNCLIAYDNKADLAALTLGSYAAGLPLDNLLDLNPKKVARTSDDANASTKFKFVLSSVQLLQFFGLFNTNASLTATARLRLYSDVGASVLIYDSGTITLYPAGSMAQGTIPFGAPNWWTAVPTYDDLNRYQRNIFHFVPGALYARSGLFEIFDTANPDTYFQAGRLFLGKVFQPMEVNMLTGAAIQVKPRSTMTRARGGTKYFTRLRSDINFPFALGRLLESEGRRLVDLQAAVDTSGEVVFMWDPDDLAFWQGRSVAGQLAQLDPITHPQFGNFATAYQIEGNL